MCRSWLRPDNLLLRSRFRAASEARRKSVLKLFANLRSCKSLDRQRVSGGWLCARCEAFLHHILRSMGGKCWLCIKYYHYLYSALDSQRAALPPPPPPPNKRGIFSLCTFCTLMTNSRFEKSWKRKSLSVQCQCKTLLVLRKEMKILSKWNLRL